jgi:potassium efflux system protein
MNLRRIANSIAIGGTPGLAYHGLMHFLSRALFLLFALGFNVHAAHAEEIDAAKLFDEGREQVSELRKQLQAGKPDNGKLDTLRDAAGSIAGRANALIADRVPKLETIDARLAELGEAPAKGDPPEASDISAQRKLLSKTRTDIDAELKRAKLLVADSQQLAGEIAEARRELFQAELTQRTSSPLAAPFWNEVAANKEGDTKRISTLTGSIRSSLSASFEAANRTPAILGLVFGILLVVFGRWASERIWLNVTSDRMPQGRLRRSALAFAILIISTILPGLGAQIIVLGLNWNDVFVQPFAGLTHVFVNTMYFGGLILGLGRALLSASRPSWRLAPIPDEVAARLRPFPLIVAVIAVGGFFLTRINSVIGTSLSATIATSFVVAIVYCLLIGSILVTLNLTRRAISEEKPALMRTPMTKLVIALATIGMLAALVCATTGYVALALFITRQMIWAAVVFGVYYVVTSLFEDLSTTLLSSRSPQTKRSSGARASTIDQAGVLLAGIFRVTAFIFAVSLVLAQFGTGPGELMYRIAQTGMGFSIGQIRIAPTAVLSSAAIIFIGLYFVRVLKRWLAERYLPTTQLDPGIRNSITTLIGYVGGIIVFAFTLSAVGLSLERIAWVASALSVGIGFGLQAIVQNFISGLILLVERPVKVGDLIALGDMEGDIRRINVRATEIQLGDRSTVIVPNSELITKTVRNLTLANAEGRIRIRLPLPIDTDARRVREIVQQAFKTQTALLTSPSPSVLLDSIDGSSLIFLITAYINSPRGASGARSELLIEILSRLREEGIALITPQDINIATRKPLAVEQAPHSEGSPSLSA